ncbi:MAG: cytochrome c, partial [Sphingobacteriales bacterium]|nr:cytochrome c [Sphingobacteriales bacterium]
MQAQDPRTDAAYQKGATLFKAQCTSCHQVHKKVVGPALAGVYDKYSKEWLYSWVKNSQSMVKAGDPQAIAIFNEYNKSVMTAFALSNEEIDAMIGLRQSRNEVPAVAALLLPGTTEVAENKS